jgi:selenocysteine-specific elongation factor
LIVLTKTDMVDGETLELAELEVNEMLAGTFLEKCPILKFSAKGPEQGRAIMQGIDEALTQLPCKKDDRPFRLWIDQVKSIPGHGTVVSGTVMSGRIHCHDEIEIQPAGIKSRARNLESHGSTISQAVAGQRVGINLHRVPLKDVGRGMSLGMPGAAQPVFMLNAEIRILATAGKGIQNRQKIKIYLGTSVTRAVMVLMRGQVLAPGQTGLVQIRLARPITALPRDPLVISPMNVNTIIAGGHVMEASREKFRAAKSGIVLSLLTALRKADTQAYIETLCEHRKGGTITARELSVKTGLPQTAFERTINAKVQKGELFYLKGHGAIKTSHLTVLQRQFKSVMEAAFAKDPMKKNVGLMEIAEHLEYRVADSLLKVTADALCDAGQIARIDGGFRLADTEPRLDAHHESQASFLMDFMQNAGLTPISPNLFWKRHQSQYSQAKVGRLFKYLLSQNRLIRLKDNRFLALNALEEIKRRVTQRIGEKGFVALGDCKELFGFGRAGGAHVLDYLNEIGFTVRRENRHYLNRDGIQ